MLHFSVLGVEIRRGFSGVGGCRVGSSRIRIARFVGLRLELVSHRSEKDVAVSVIWDVAAFAVKAHGLRTSITADQMQTGLG